MTRYQVFIEESEDEGAGELADLETIAECWSWLDQRFEGYGKLQLWWIKDRQQEQVAAQMHSEDTWQACCETPSVFMLWLGMFFEWDESDHAYSAPG